MKHYSAKKLALAGMFCAVAVVGSVFSFPVFGSKCAPVQHMVNILCAVLLGPYYGVGVAFLIRILRIWKKKPRMVKKLRQRQKRKKSQSRRAMSRMRNN